MPKIYYSGTLITPDGSDHSPHGDPCEPGTGATMRHGWVDPSWSRYDLYDDYSDTTPDIWEPADGPLIDWLIDMISQRLGHVELPSGPDVILYATESDDDMTTGKSISLAAHFADVTEPMLSALYYGLAHRQKG